MHDQREHTVDKAAEEASGRQSAEGSARASSRSGLFDDAFKSDFMRFVVDSSSSEGKDGSSRNDASESGELSGKDWAIDAAIALLAFGFGCAQLYLTSRSVVYVDVVFREMAGLVNFVPNVYAFVAVGFTTLPLALRRAAPWAIFAVVLSCFVFSSGFMDGSMLLPVGPAVAAFTIAKERGWREALAAVAIALVAMLVAPSHAQSETLSLIVCIQNILLVVAGGLAGVSVRLYQAYLGETKRRLEEAEHGKEELAARRVAEERVRIARDVHDITAHSLSAVAIQAAAAERLIDVNPDAAKEAIGDIRAVAKDSLEEIRSMIGVLRGDEPAAQAPAEGTERMGDVIDYLRRAGLEVGFSDRGYARDSVPAFVDMALFSLAREAATNTVRHADARKVSIVLRSMASNAGIMFSDDGRGFDAQAREGSAGHGLQGMGERIEALHGTFRVKSAPGAGCVVEAEIPLEVPHGGDAVR